MRKKHLFALVALSIVGLLPMAQAEEVVDDRFYVAPFGTFIQPGGDRKSDNGWGGGMGFGKMLNEHFNVELKGFYQNLHGGTYGGSDMTGGIAEAQYYIFRDKFSPYTVIGLGGMNTSHNYGSGASFIGEAGAGFTYEVSDNFLVRSDVRYRYNQNFNANLQPGTNEFHDMVVNLGFVVPFGPKPVAHEVVAEAPPAPTPVAAADCSTMDDDNDGINNCDDLCPNTLPGVKVSIKGCWIVDVKFDNDKAIVKPEYFANLDQTAAEIKSHPELQIEIQGHTSKTGGFKHNMKLSERRALAVKNYLVDGTHSPNLTTKGYGWTRPIDTNDTEEGRANNRRVQLEVNGQPQQPLNR
ncbi:MAG: OmpA family protein [Methylococcales bacterium]|nr:OmpA family protein [Methylococcales bacterium]